MILLLNTGKMCNDFRAIDLMPGNWRLCDGRYDRGIFSEASPDLSDGENKSFRPHGRYLAYNFSTARQLCCNAAADGVGLIKMEKVCTPLMVQKR